MNKYFNFNSKFPKKLTIGNTPLGGEPLIVKRVLDEAKLSPIYIAQNRYMFRRQFMFSFKI